VSRSTQLAPALPQLAIIGMAGRFPGAKSVSQFWENQVNGVEAISHFTTEELEVPNAHELAKDPNYVKARSILSDVDQFDADFFGIYPREAELMDPQHRVFLECCWESFEDAGYDPFAYQGPVGVFAGCSMSSYFLSRLCTAEGFIQKFTGAYQVGNYPEMMGSSLDFLSTRVSYKLNLRGPSFTLQAGCSTSLIAVCQACQSLLTYACDMALAGGSSITFPQKRGSFYQEGGMISPDGHCRTFDAGAQGTVFGSGVAVVLLKRLDDALRDGDHVYAVIRGFALNNDGSSKVGYTAPSVEGQARVIAMAHELANVRPEDIGYVEAHGTGTPLGDPIELVALKQAFALHTSKKNFCAVGTAKTNVGHLDVAAGVTGLIHAAHIVRDGILPATLHFRKPNPKFDLDNSPFYVNTQCTAWKSDASPRIAGVSAFGVGGTNAHVVLEQAPERPSPPQNSPAQLLMLSARSETALERATDNLVAHLKSKPHLNLADVAWTLQVGRRSFACRRSLVASDIQDAIDALSRRDSKRVQTHHTSDGEPSICFLFPGQGSQHANMGRELYQAEGVFRKTVDECAEILRPDLQIDIRTLLYPGDAGSEESANSLTNTVFAQPAIFVTGYALAQLWMSWGIQPQTMLGHSVGEFVAACVSGVFSLQDALRLIAARGKMMQSLPRGGMLSVRLPEAEIHTRLSPALAVAAVNTPNTCVVAGPHDALNAFQQQLDADGVACRPLATSHAFHSAMMDPIIDQFAARVAQARLAPPKIPFISGVTGTWITDQQATDPAYWARHVRQPVQFSAGVRELTKKANTALLEVGPGNVLSILARQHLKSRNGSLQDIITATSLSRDSSGQDNTHEMLNALGSLWLAGAEPDWKAVHCGEQRRRIPLPTYPFERKRYWFDPPAKVQPDFAAHQPQVSSLADTMRNRSEEHAIVDTTVKPASSPSPQPSGDRATKISAMLADIFEDLSGVQISPADQCATFLEMGFDSLFLTQVTQAVQSKFNVKLTFRQLLGEVSSLQSLTKYLDEKLPPAFLSEQVSASPASVQRAAPDPAEHPKSLPTITPAQLPRINEMPVSVSTVSSPSESVERLLREQLQTINQVFAKQLEILQGSTVTIPASSIAAPHAATPSATLQIPLPPAPVHTSSKPTASEKEEFKPFGPYKPPQKGLSGELTRQQQNYLDGLIERYTRRTAKSKKATQEYRFPLADPRVVSGFRAQWKEIVYPILTNRSKGARLWDIDGNEYIDILNGFGPIMLGHRPDFVETAIEQQLHEGFEIGPQTPLAGEVAKMFCEMTGNERMTFCNTGSEAVLAALRVARTVTARDKVVLFAGAYHGMFDEVLVKGVKKSGLPHTLPVAPGIPRESVGNIVVLDYGTPESLEWIRAHASELAAVLAEPVQSRHPNLQPREFLREIRKITEECGTALIFDEVVTGFRVHPGGCQALFDIRADLATYGKVVAGGMPIGVLAGKAQFMDALDGGSWQFGDDSYPSVGVTFFAGTFVRHPLAVAAAKAVLQHLKEQGPGLQERLSSQTASLVRSLNQLFETNQVPSRIDHFASIFYFSFPSDFPLGSLLYYHLREKGIFLLEGFPCFLTTAHTQADIQQIVRSFEQSIAEMQDGGVLPRPAGAPASEQLHQPAPIAASARADIADAAPVEAPLSSSTQQAPLTEAQLEIWLSAQLSDQASCAYNESFTLHLRGALHERALRASLNDLLSRHEALRATVVPQSNSLRFGRAAEFPISFEELSAAGDPQSRLDRIKQEEARTPFDLTNGPVIRGRLIRLESQHHALVITSHHMFCDGWSTNVLLDELGKLYSARVNNTAVDLPGPVEFSRYAHEQEQQSKTSNSNEVASYWLTRFQDPVPPLELPYDRPRPAVKSFKGATHRTRIEAAAYKQIKQSGARLGCTLFATLLSGFATLLHRLANQNDIVIGIPAAGQSLLENGSLVGHCVNFLPIRIRLLERQRAAELLQEVKRTLLDAYDHQSYTYGTLVRKLKLRRDPSRLPLVEAQFNLEKVGAGAEFTGLETEVDPNPKASVNFDLFLNVVESSNGLLIDCDYNTDLFDSQTITRWLAHFETLLKSIASDVDRPVDDLPILSDSERHRMLVEWNATAADFPRNKCVHELIAEQTTRTPESIAVTHEGQNLTYAELDQRSNRLARYLIKIGVAPGSLVGISLDRSLDMMVALLAVWKAGAAYLPLDPTYPRERLEFILEETSLSILLTQSKIVPNLPAFETQLVCLDRDWVLIAREPETNPNVVVDSSSVAYTIYTSGSTGKPKGVQVTHRNVVNLLCSMREKPGLQPHDRLLAVTTLSFDIAALELFLPLVTGAQVILSSRTTAADGRLLLKLIKDSGATVLQGTPATWRLLLEAGWTGTPGLKILCGGEALPRALANQLVRCGEVWNMYGPTETTIWSATSRVEGGEGPVPVGPPIRNTQFYVLDNRQQPVPVGVPGELFIGGEGVALGYYRNRELTSARFVPDELAKDSAGRLYKTGDLVRYRPDGTLEFLGRLDNQVKVRGYRIELGEIESALAKHPAVRESTVVAQEDEPGVKRLVAYIVADQDKPSSDDLRGWIANSLPDYMVPSVFSFVPALPKTPNGKVDRKALIQLTSRDFTDDRAFVAPRNPIEDRLCAICAEVLQLNKISIHDSLFDLGADSVRLFQIIARAAREGLNITPLQVLQLRSISALAAAANASAAVNEQNQAIPRAAREKYQLTPALQ
jgi:amino acid adenylation domain-containing protein